MGTTLAEKNGFLTELDRKIAKGIAKGKTINKVSRDLDIHPMTTYKHLKKEGVIKLIQKIQEKIIERDLPKAAENWGEYLNSEPTEPIDKKIKFDATRDTLKAGGALPAEHQSTYVQNIITQNNLVISPLVQDIISRHVKSLTFKGGYVDGEIVQSEESKEVDGSVEEKSE